MVSFRKAVTVVIAAIAATLVMADNAVAKEGTPTQAKTTVRHSFHGPYGYGGHGHHHFTSSHKKYRRRFRRRFGYGPYGHGGHGYHGGYGGRGFYGGRGYHGGYGRGYYY